MRYSRLYIALLLCAAVLVAVAAPAALASGAYGKYLPPDQAFQLSTQATAHKVVLNWRIADGYYLYRGKFNVVATHGTIGKPSYPPGIEKTDPYFGQVEIYKRAVRVAVPYKKAPANGKLALQVTYQGCAENGICYPPITRQLTIPLAQDTAAGRM